MSMIINTIQSKEMKNIERQFYEEPSIKLIELRMNQSILGLSGSVGLLLAGVDESDADDNGSIW